MFLSLFLNLLSAHSFVRDYHGCMTLFSAAPLPSQPLWFYREALRRAGHGFNGLMVNLPPLVRGNRTSKLSTPGLSLGADSLPVDDAYPWMGPLLLWFEDDVLHLARRGRLQSIDSCLGVAPVGYVLALPDSPWTRTILDCLGSHQPLPSCPSTGQSVLSLALARARQLLEQENAAAATGALALCEVLVALGADVPAQHRAAALQDWQALCQSGQASTHDGVLSAWMKRAGLLECMAPGDVAQRTISPRSPL
jgi:hypothetical protein